MDDLIIFGAKYLIFIIALVCLVAWLTTETKNRWQFAAAAVLAVILVLAMVKLAQSLYFHHRPFVVEGIRPLINHPDDNSFPSDHTALAAAAASAVYFYRRQLGIALLGLAGLVGISRVLAHIHWAVDIISGLVLGVIAGWIGYQLAKKLVPSDKKSLTEFR